jgi:4-aminobutyrate aminotransferase-like enzyme
MVCRAGEVVMDRLEGAGFIDSVNARGKQLMDGLRAGLSDCATVAEVRATRTSAWCGRALQLEHVGSCQAKTRRARE